MKDTPVSSLYGAPPKFCFQNFGGFPRYSHSICLSIHRYPREFILGLPLKAALPQSVVIDHSTTPPNYTKELA